MPPASFSRAPPDFNGSKKNSFSRVCFPKDTTEWRPQPAAVGKQCSIHPRITHTGYVDKWGAPSLLRTVGSACAQIALCFRADPALCSLRMGGGAIVADPRRTFGWLNAARTQTISPQRIKARLVGRRLGSKLEVGYFGQKPAATLDAPALGDRLTAGESNS